MAELKVGTTLSGDQLRLEVKVTGWRPSAHMIAAKMQGLAFVNEKRVAEAIVSCQLIDSSRGRGSAHDGGSGQMPE